MKKKTIIIYNNMLFSSPKHLLNHFELMGIDTDISIKYLTQCAYKKVKHVKGIHLSYRVYDMEQEAAVEMYERIKSMARSGQGYTFGAMTPIDYFNTSIKPLLKDVDPVEAAINLALEKNLGTRKDYEELIAKTKGGK